MPVPTSFPTPVPPPTLAGFQNFVTTIMGVPTSALPSNSPYFSYALNISMLTANTDLNFVGTYALAVYNLAGSLLLNFAPDQPGSSYFRGLRSNGEMGYDLVGFQPGVVAASSDVSTSTTLLVPDALKGLTIGDLQRLKDPYGRQYLIFAQDAGPTIWGLS